MNSSASPPKLDYASPQKVAVYLKKYERCLDVLSPATVLSFYVIARDASKPEQFVNRLRAIDYLGFIGEYTEELRALAKYESDTQICRHAERWISEREMQMVAYLDAVEEPNMFGRMPASFFDSSAQGVVTALPNTGLAKRFPLVFLSFSQRVDLHISNAEVSFFEPQVQISRIAVNEKFSVPVSSFPDVLDQRTGCGIRVSAPLAERLSLKIGSRVELQGIQKEEFYV